MRLAKMATILGVVLLVTAGVAHAQTATGEVNGTVTDKSGGFVAGASVMLANQATKIEDRVTTNSDGYFAFINVKPGTYVLEVAAKGFKITQVSPFDVAINQTVTQTVRLEVGAINEKVVVCAEALMLEGSTSELGTVITQKAVNDLPLNGRNFTQLLTLTPGVTPISTSQNRSLGCCEGNVGIPGSGFSDGSFHGQSNRSKLYFYDGIINTNIRGPTYIVIPNNDLIQEFKVVGHDAKAEFGGAAGGVVNLVSKAGGNALHGSAFEYVRNNFFDARDTFADGPSGCTIARCPNPGQLVPGGPAAFHQNQFGAAVTGPIIRNKTFLSAGYDGWRYSKPDQALSYVPTVAELSGDFTNTSSSFKKQIFNPYSTRQVGTIFVRDAFRCDAAGNPLPLNGQLQQDQSIGTTCFKIPQALIFGPMQQFFKTYAATPNFTGDAQNNFAQVRPTTNRSDGFQFKIDHRLSDNDNIFFRYTRQRVTVFNPIGESGSTSGSSNGLNYGGGWTHTFSPNLILDVRAGYAGRPGVDASHQNQHNAGLEPLKSAGFKDVDKYGGLLVTLQNWAAGGSGNFGIRGAALRENPNWSITPSLSWLKGNHNIRTDFGYIEAKRIQLNTFQTYSFNG